MKARKAYEGMAAYEAGVKEGREQMIDQFCEFVCPTVLNMLALISEDTNEESTAELANDCYNFLMGVEFKAIPLVYKGNIIDNLEIKLP